MSETINCAACGAPNNVSINSSESKCVFCDSILNQTTPAQISENSKKAAPKIFLAKEKVSPKKGKLSLENRGISSIMDVVYLLSNKELDSVESLNLSKNKIASLEGIERFKNLEYLNLSENLISDFKGLTKSQIIERIDLSQNKIKSTMGLRKFNVGYLNLSNNELTEFENFPRKTRGTYNINLSHNKKLTKFKDELLCNIATHDRANLSFNFRGCDDFDYMGLYNYCSETLGSVKIETSDKKKLPQEFIDLGFEPTSYTNEWRYNGYNVRRKKASMSYKIKNGFKFLFE